MEDATTLGVLFSVFPEASALEPARLQDAITSRLEGYFSLRLSRCSAAMLASRANRKFFHLEDGPDQETRDERFAHANPIAVEEDNRSTFDYDSEKIAKKWLNENILVRESADIGKSGNNEKATVQSTSPTAVVA